MAYEPHLSVPGSRTRTCALAAVLAIALAAAPAPADARGLTGAEILAGVYDDILNAAFDRAEARLRQACGRAVPPPACEVMTATALWWRLQLDRLSPALDGALMAAIDEAIAATEAWAEREPARAEAWFYVGGAYAVRVQFRVLRNQRLAAARDGKRIKEALERAVDLDPQLDDAYFGIGLYRYYADVAPVAARLFRWLLLLPGGDREEGLAQMLRAQAQGELLRSEADYQLYLIYLWYEKQPEQAAALLDGLRARHPANPVFRLEAARIRDVYFHDVAGSLALYREVLEAAERRAVHFPEVAAVEARLGMAQAYESLCETDRAIETLLPIVAMRPRAPYGALAEAHAQLGAAYDRLGQREQAVRSYQAVLASAPPDDPLELRDLASRALRQAPDPRAANAYRLSLEGWRALERRALDEADAAIAHALQINADPLTRYRHGRVLAARGAHARALAEFEHVIAAQPTLPGPLLAAAYLAAGTALERIGDPARAARMYEAATSAFGGSAATRAAARRALARLARGRSASRSAPPL